MKKFAIICLLISMSHTLYAESLPRRVAADKHVKRVMYDPNNVVVLHGRYGYQTDITFAANETVQSVSLGDSLAWQAVPVTNHLFIKPVTASTTNMTVLTNANTYSFQLDTPDSSLIPPTYKLQFLYPDGGVDASGNANAVGHFDPATLNWKYSFTGDRSLAPIEAFDNGQFTYFKFKSDGMSHHPALFIVDKERNETLVNYHIQGEYTVVNALAKQFTLRDGSDVTSVYNDLAIGDWKKLS
jgi:type IV secretion system protein VirB9